MLLLVLTFAQRNFRPSCSPVFPLASKPNISKLQFDQELGDRRTTTWLCYLDPYRYLSSLSLFIYFFFFADLHHGFIREFPTLDRPPSPATGRLAHSLSRWMCRSGLRRKRFRMISKQRKTEESQLQLLSCIVSAYILLSAVCRLPVVFRKLKGSLSFYLAIVSSVDWILTRFDDKRSNHIAIFFPDKALVSKNQTHTSINAFCMTPETKTIWSWQHALTLLIM